MTGRVRTATRRNLAVALAVLTAACGHEAPVPEGGNASSATTAPAGPPSTDIWLASLERGSDGALTVGNPVNVTHRPGYDNQPYFLPDGSGFWYTAIDSAGQADIWFHDLSDGANRPVVTTSPESEYSATYLGAGGGFSVIRVEADSTQRLWRFDMDGTHATVLLPDVKPVGYQAWADDHTVVMYVLGDPSTLQVGDVATGSARVVARDVGTSIQTIPGTHDVSYVQNVGKDSTEIRRLDVRASTSTLIAPGVAGAAYHAWTPDGVLLQAHGSVLYAWSTDGGGWQQVADLTAEGITLSRLAVSPDGRRIALVGVAGGG